MNLESVLLGFIIGCICGACGIAGQQDKTLRRENLVLRTRLKERDDTLATLGLSTRLRVNNSRSDD